MLLEFPPHILPASITILQHIEFGNKQKLKIKKCAGEL